MQLIVAPESVSDIRERNRDMVSRCEQQVPVGATNENRVAYDSATLIRRSDGIHLQYNYHVTVWPKTVSLVRASKLVQDLKSCNALLNQVWNRYGLKTDLSVYTGPAVKESRIFINLIDDASRSNIKNFYSMRSQSVAVCFEACALEDLECLNQCEAFRKESFCMMVLHESGHHLELADEYPEEDRGKLQIVSFNARPWSVMDTTYEPIEDLEFLPRHLRQVLPTLCPDVLSEEERRQVARSKRALEVSRFHKAMWAIFPDLILPSIPET
jgi:hypothetical protein